MNDEHSFYFVIYSGIAHMVLLVLVWCDCADGHSIVEVGL